MLGTAPTMLGTAPTMLGTAPTMRGTASYIPLVHPTLPTPLAPHTPSSGMLLAVIMFLAGTPWYIRLSPSGDSLRGLAHYLVQAAQRCSLAVP